MLESQSQAQKT